jgi:hypothetical protein
MTTTLDKNIFVQNGQLYISPTLTSDEIGNDAIFNGGTYTLDVRPCYPYRSPLVTQRRVLLGMHQLDDVDVIIMLRHFRSHAKNRHTPCTECADQHQEFL